METVLLLKKDYNGLNSILEIKLSAEEMKRGKINNADGFLDLADFLKDRRLDYQDALLELAVVLKIKKSAFQTMVQKSNTRKAFITLDAALNIDEYLKIRLCPLAINFLNSQLGSTEML